MPAKKKAKKRTSRKVRKRATKKTKKKPTKKRSAKKKRKPKKTKPKKKSSKSKKKKVAKKKKTKTTKRTTKKPRASQKTKASSSSKKKAKVEKAPSGINITIRGGADLIIRKIQAMTKATLSKVKKLTIEPGSDGWEDGDFVFNLKMPRLEVLSIETPPFGKIKLNDSLTPRLKELHIQGLGEETQFDVLCSKLQEIHLLYSMIDIRSVHNMLMKANNLKIFTSYKTQYENGTQLNFASHKLEIVEFYRADELMAMTIYSPVLKVLNMIECDSIRIVEILKKRTGFPPINEKTASKFLVSGCHVNSRRAIHEHENYDDDEEEEGWSWLD